jgi:hypothetical protein
MGLDEKKYLVGLFSDRFNGLELQKHGLVVLDEQMNLYLCPRGEQSGHQMFSPIGTADMIALGFNPGGFIPINSRENGCVYV